MKRSACLPLLLTAVLLCSCGSNAKKGPHAPRPVHQRGAPVCRAQRRRHHRHLLHQFG